MKLIRLLDSIGSSPIVARASRLAGAIWTNPITGQGTSRDKSQGMEITPALLLTDAEKTILFHQDFLARRVADKFPREALKRGFSYASKIDKKLPQKINRDLDRLDAVRATLEAWIYARNFGGAVIVMGVLDGQKASEPVNLKRLQGIEWLEVVDRRWVNPLLYETDPNAKSFGRPSVFQVSSPNGASGMAREIHASRMLIFRGPQTTPDVQQMLGSWDISIHDLIIQALAKFNGAWGSAGSLLDSAHQGVFKIKNFAQMLMGKEADQLITRLQIVDLYRSIMRSIVIDADSEGFEWKTAPITGVAELLQQYSHLISAASETPTAILMGQSPAGLNATGEADFRGFYDRAQTEQKTYVYPTIRPLLTYLVQSYGAEWPDDGTLSFPSLWTATPKEAAETTKAQNEADKVLIDGQQALPEEIALFRDANGYDMPFALDDQGRAARTQALRDLYAKPPEPLPSDPTDPQRHLPSIPNVEDD